MRTAYGDLASRLARGVDAAGCCGCGPIVVGNYDPNEGIPGLVRQSLGCGNPIAAAQLREGEAVLDLGSGAGLDALLSQRMVGASGLVLGLDGSAEMAKLAERNRLMHGAANVRFLVGDIESIPLRDACVGVVISNCVLNLAPNKRALVREVFRVLRPGGRLVASDILRVGGASAEHASDPSLWSACFAGAAAPEVWRELLLEAGFCEVEVSPQRFYDPDKLPLSSSCGVGPEFCSGLLRARKPA
ncbi:MAG: methyltransferase domain-containing protein [Fimbriimonadales bacterium]|nr:methyltransferase domain-containing protein [Fimbriimonadales bacterium]